MLHVPCTSNVSKLTCQTQLFLPPILRRQLFLSDQAAALSLSHRYQSLPYFAHALEILLHTVLDDEVDHPPTSSSSLLPSVLSFLASFPSYLDILVQCTRKTEVRSWRTLFAHLPPPQALFEASLEKRMLKTAGGYLLVLQTFDQEGTGSEQCVRLMQLAKEEGDWDLCKELARFLMAIDETGNELRKAIEKMDINLPHSSHSHTPISDQADAEHEKHVAEVDSRSKAPRPNSNGAPKGHTAGSVVNQDNVSPKDSAGERVGLGDRSEDEGTRDGQEDYFSHRRGV